VEPGGGGELDELANCPPPTTPREGLKEE